MLINFKDKGKWGYYNSQTQKTIPAQFQEDSDFVNGFAIVKQYSNLCYGVIDEDGHEKIPFIFSRIERQKNGLFKAGPEFAYGLINNMGQELMACDYTQIQFKKPIKNDIINSDTMKSHVIGNRTIVMLLKMILKLFGVESGNDKVTW